MSKNTISVKVTVTFLAPTDNTVWTASETSKLVEAWLENPDVANQSGNVQAMKTIAEHIGTDKTARQVAIKVG